jgi:hypothetical protein
MYVIIVLSLHAVTVLHCAPSYYGRISKEGRVPRKAIKEGYQGRKEGRKTIKEGRKE